MFKKFNNVFAILLTILIVGMWILHGLGIVTVPEIILGATISAFTMIVTFYFRKKETAPVV